MARSTVWLSLAVAVALALVAGWWLAPHADPRPQTEPAADAATLDDLRREVAALRAADGLLPSRTIATYPLPKVAQLCGQPVPLERADVREALAIELAVTAGRPMMPMLWTRRAPAALPLIEARLSARNAPDDLKYVAVIESDLRWTTRSPAGALGLWQFIEETGRRSGLRIDKFVDERRDPERATDAAVAHLADLKARLGDWFLALAAYNAGEGAVRKAVEDQGGGSFFDLYLPSETRRYVFRVLAAKLILESPATYGLVAMTPEFVARYEPVVLDAGAAGIDLRTEARRRGWSYSALRIANPQLLGPALPRGSYRVRVPQGPPPVGLDGM